MDAITTKACVPGPSHVWLGLGSNLGDARAHLAQAQALLGRIPGTRLDAASTVWLTEPQGDADQPWFANQVVRLACDRSVSARYLLGHARRIEDSMGRRRDPARRFGPRVIDIDILLLGGHTLAEPDLIVPHPRMHRRAFVLVPLCELEHDIEIPGIGSARAALRALPHTVNGDVISQPFTTENH